MKQKEFISKVREIVPWEVTIIETLEKTILLILPGVLVEIVPGSLYGSNYLIKFGEHDACRISTKDVEYVFTKVRSIVKGEVDRTNRVHAHHQPLKASMDSIEARMNKLALENEALRKSMAEREKAMHKRFDEVLVALALHPTGPEAELIRKDFCSLASGH